MSNVVPFPVRSKQLEVKRGDDPIDVVMQLCNDAFFATLIAYLPETRAVKDFDQEFWEDHIFTSAPDKLSLLTLIRPNYAPDFGIQGCLEFVSLTRRTRDTQPDPKPLTKPLFEQLDIYLSAFEEINVEAMQCAYGIIDMLINRPGISPISSVIENDVLSIEFHSDEVKGEMFTYYTMRIDCLPLVINEAVAFEFEDE